MEENQGTKSPPRAYICYDREDGEIQEMVLSFAYRLRQDGVDAWIDKFESNPEKSWLEWIEQQFHNADFVLFIVSGPLQGQSKSTSPDNSEKSAVFPRR